MTEVKRMLKRMVSATVVVGALAFGASTLMASPALTTCPDDGDNFLGTCTNQAECQVKCEDAHPTIPHEEIIGKCFGGCCSCLY
jgi:hypothetical protein